MNFLNLQYFRMLAQERNFTSAAEKLYISQQSLSEHIKKLEAEVGTALIVRKRPLELTPAGEIFYRAAGEMLDIKEKMLYDITESLSADERHLTIGIPTYEDPPYLAGLLAYFSQEFPQIRVDVKKKRDTAIQECMKDISFYFSIPPLNEHLAHVCLIRNDLNGLVARQSLLEKTFGSAWKETERKLLETGDLTLLKKLPFLFVQDAKGRLQRQSELLFEEAGFEPIISFCSDNGNLNSAFCLQGKGAKTGTVFLLRASFQEQLDVGEDPLRLFALRTRRESLPVALSYRKGKEFTPVENCFLTAARRYLQSVDQEYEGPYKLEDLEEQFLY